MKNRKAVIGILLGFVSLYIVAMDNYMIEWLARRWFCLLWVPVIIALLMDKRKFAYTFLIGVLGAMPVGQIAQNIKWMIYDRNEFYGHTLVIAVPVYFFIVIISAAIGIIREIRTKNCTDIV